MLGGRPLQNLSGDMHGDAALWAIDRLDLRAPGSTRIAFNAARAPVAASGNFSGVLDIDCSDPDVLFAWLQGKNDIVRRTQKPLHLNGDVSVTRDRVAIDQLKAEIEGGTVEGRVAVVSLSPGPSARVEAALKAERLDLDAAAAFVRSLAGPDANWPDEAAISLDIGHAISAGQELRPFAAKFGYNSKTLSLAQLKFGQPGGVVLEGSGNFDRSDATGHLALNASAASLGQITSMVAPIAPAVAARLDQAATAPGPVRANLALDIARNPGKTTIADARAAFELNAPQLNGTATVTAKPEIAALRGFDLDKLGRNELTVESKFSAERASALLARAARSRSCRRGRRGRGPIRGIGERRVESATAAEREGVGRRHRRRSAGHGRALGDVLKGHRQRESAQHQSCSGVRPQAVRSHRAKHPAVRARLAHGQQAHA